MGYETINDYYSQIVEAVFDKQPFTYFDDYYFIKTGMEPEFNNPNYVLWVDYLLDKYNNYRHAGFTDDESQINSLMDGLEGLLR